MNSAPKERPAPRGRTAGIEANTRLTPSQPSSISAFQARAVAESLLGAIDWHDSFAGYAHRCPGEHLHTRPTGKRDCQILLDGVPTVFCFHTSCLGILEQKNHALRSAIGKAERCGFNQTQWRPSPQDIARRSAKERAEKLKERAKVSLPAILERFPVAQPDVWESSPFRLDGDIKDEWRLHLGLFKPEDVLWIGDKYDSAAEDKPDWQKERAALHFRTVAEWLKESKAPGNFTCGSVFKNNIHSRSNENVLSRPFLIIESDPNPEKGTGLNRAQMLSVTAWCQQFMRLRAIVDTGGKSLHSWFDYPDDAAIAELKLILPSLGCDPALFKPAQPCRLAGAWRSEKCAFQHFLFLDLQ